MTTTPMEGAPVSIGDFVAAEMDKARQARESTPHPDMLTGTGAEPPPQAQFVRGTDGGLVLVGAPTPNDLAVDDAKAAIHQAVVTLVMDSSMRSHPVGWNPPVFLKPRMVGDGYAPFAVTTEVSLELLGDSSACVDFVSGVLVAGMGDDAKSAFEVSLLWHVYEPTRDPEPFDPIPFFRAVCMKRKP